MPEIRMIDNHQKRTIWGIWKKRIGLADADLYDAIRDRFGYMKMREMTWGQADLFIRELRQQAKYTAVGASHAQINKILATAREWEWTDQGLRRFLRRVAKVDRVEWLDGKGAWKVIAAMQTMADRARKDV